MKFLNAAMAFPFRFAYFFSQSFVPVRSERVPGTQPKMISITNPQAPVQYESEPVAEVINSNRDNHLWLQCWLDQHTDFHQTEVNPLLSKFWPSLELSKNSRIFVPLCGKSLDMIWLAGQGHEVIGVELSPVAVNDFFRENGLQPIKQEAGPFTLWRNGKISILCGDFFALTKADLGKFDTVYDRAALTALPENIRALYVTHLSSLVPGAAKVFLLTIEDAAENATMIQANGVDDEIEKLYSLGFEIDLAYVESVFEPDLESPVHALKRAEYKVYRLTSKQVTFDTEPVITL